MTEPRQPKNAWQKGRKGPDSRQRPHQLNVRLSEEEAASCRAMAAARGISVGALLRGALLSVPLPRRRPRPVVGEKLLGEVLAELAALKAEWGKQGSNLNQLAHQANADRLPPGCKEMLADAIERHEEGDWVFLELRDACMRALGFERGGGDED